MYILKTEVKQRAIQKAEMGEVKIDGRDGQIKENRGISRDREKERERE